MFAARAIHFLEVSFFNASSAIPSKLPPLIKASFALEAEFLIISQIFVIVRIKISFYLL